MGTSGAIDFSVFDLDVPSIISSTVGSSLAISGLRNETGLFSPYLITGHNDQGAFKIRLDCGTNVAVPHPTSKPARRPLDATALRRIALHYAGRYATTKAKLAAYLMRKIAERGWEGEGAPPVSEIVEQFAELGYVDDRAFGEARAAALARRGYGERRVSDALKVAGIGEEDASAIRIDSRARALDAALAFARRKRIGPFAAQTADRDEGRRQIAAMLRAGHPLDLARRILAAAPGEVPGDDEAR